VGIRILPRWVLETFFAKVFSFIYHCVDSEEFRPLAIFLQILIVPFSKLKRFWSMFLICHSKFASKNGEIFRKFQTIFISHSFFSHSYIFRVATGKFFHPSTFLILINLGTNFQIGRPISSNQFSNVEGNPNRWIPKKRSRNTLITYSGGFAF